MIKTLIALRLRSAFASVVGRDKKSGKITRPSVGKIIAFSVLYLYVALFFVGTFALMSLSLASLTLPLGLDWLYFALFILITFMVIFVFGIFETKSQLFECKDNELLLSMPIKPSHIVLSRIFTLLIYNYIEGAMVMLPAIVCYALLGGNIRGIIGGIIILIFLPLIALSLSAAVGYAVAMISKRFKNKTLLTTLISLAFIALYFVFYSWLMGSGSEEMTPEMLEELAAKLAFLEGIGSIGTLHIAYTPLFVLISVAISLLAYYIISSSYVNIVTYSAKTKKAVYKRERLEKRSALYALTKKELSRFFSSATYILNSAMGIVFAVLLGGVVLFNGESVRELIALLGTEGIGGGVIYALAICLISLVGSMNIISAASVSLEGKSLWIPRTMPISGRDVLFSKTAAHLVITTPPTILVSVVAIIALGVPAEYWAFYILSPLATNLVCASFGTVMNTAMPKFDFQNEAVPIKQSLATFVVMTGVMLFEMLISVGSFFLAIIGFPLLTAALALVLKMLISSVLLIVMCIASARRFESFAA